MKKQMIFIVFMVLFIFQSICFAEAPHQVGGFVLGKYINDYKDKVHMAPAIPLRYQEYINELKIKKMKGFKSGLIWIGNCSEPDRILRIKLKYFDSSKKFFKELLKRYKKRLGEPSEWRGDPFHIVIAWKWSFIDKDNNRISLILQHNTKDEEEKIGNAVKLTMTNLIEKERICYQKMKSESFEKATKSKDREPIDWDMLIPR
jgi:hypothetical protein